MVEPGGVAFTELRIHGVSGTPPESMLRHNQVRRVAGDASSGFYRRSLAVTDGPDVVDRHLEAYSWSGLTSGGATRALWLLLLPFALVNVASWAQPGPPDTAPRTRAVIAAVLRLFALTLTGSVVIAAASVGMDLLAWQCAVPGSACAADDAVAGALAALDTPGRRVVLGALLPAAVIGVLWALARHTWKAYEQVSPSRTASPAPMPTEDGSLADPRFWSGDAPVRRLRALHVGGAWALLALLLAGAGAPRDERTGAQTLLTGVEGLAALLLVVCVVAVLVPRLVDRRARVDVEPRSWTVARSAVGPTGGALAAAAAVLVWTQAEGAAGPVRMPRVTQLLELGFVTQASLLVVLTLLTLRLLSLLPAGRHAPAPPAARGLATPVLATAGWLLAGGLAAGFALRAEAWLAPGDARDLDLPPLYPWVSVIVVALLVLVVPAVGVQAALRVRRLKAEQRAAVEREHPRTADDGAAPLGVAGAGADDGYLRRVRAVAAKRAVARMTDSAGDYLGVLVGAALAAVLAGTVLYLSGWATWPQENVPWLADAGSVAISLVAVGFVALGFAAYRDPRLRRTVGVIWDLTSFWPRSAHPLAPPCYAEKIIPDLTRRVRSLAGTPDQGVLLSAHSQGSVIALATVLQLDPADDAASRICLLTYGSPLTRLYCSWFPGYVNLRAYRLAVERLGGPGEAPDRWPWRNLWRATDPIGGALLALDGATGTDGLDRRLVDPAFARVPGDPAWPATFGHSGYWSDDAFERTKAEVYALRSGGRQR